MQSAALAYDQTAKSTVNPRELEAMLLLKAAKRLQKVRDNLDMKDNGLTDALLYNRKLWTIFATAMASGDNKLPQMIRNNIASLAVYIFRETLNAQINPDTGVLDSLISINREIAAGLSAR